MIKEWLSDTHLDVTIDQPVEFDVVVVLAEGIYQYLGNFEPSDVEAKL